MNLPPLKLDHNFFEEIVIEQNNDCSPEDIPFGGVCEEGDISYKVQVHERRDGDDHWAISLIVETLATNKLPYHLKVMATGVFRITRENPMDDQHEKLVVITGGSILYSATRELVATICSRMAFGPFFLPTVSFINLNKTNPST